MIIKNWDFARGFTTRFPVNAFPTKSNTPNKGLKINRSKTKLMVLRYLLYFTLLEGERRLTTLKFQW